MVVAATEKITRFIKFEPKTGVAYEPMPPTYTNRPSLLTATDCGLILLPESLMQLKAVWVGSLNRFTPTKASSLFVS